MCWPMTILDKHPEPWIYDEFDGVKDANGETMFSGGCVGMDNASLQMDDDVSKLILAAPVVLESLAVVLSDDGPRDMTPFNLLVGWLKGEPDCPPIDLGEFVKWLRGGTANIIAKDDK